MIDVKSNKDYEYPYNVYLSIGIHSKDIPANAYELLEKVLAFPFIPERERNVIHRYFRDRLTLEEAGREMGVKGERARQIIHRGLARLKKFNAELTGTQSLISERDNLLKEIAVLRYRLDELKRQCAPAEEVKGPEDIRIENMGFTVRSYNCLKRAGVRTLEDLRKLSVEEIAAIRNMGKNSTGEVICKLKEYGVTLPERREEKERPSGTAAVKE